MTAPTDGALWSPRDQRIVDTIRLREQALAGGHPRRPPQLLAPTPNAFDDDGVDDVAGVDEIDSDGTPELLLYGSIGGWFGIWPEDVSRALAQLGSPSKVVVRLDSPGGAVYDGIAIYNLLRKHPAHIEVQVDSMAASIASVVAQAGDRIIMNRGSEMMVHAAWAPVIGNADELRDFADFLDRQTLKVARIYAAEAGGAETDWLERMAVKPDGSWYLADEAVAVGLAHATEDDDTDTGAGDGVEASTGRWPLGVTSATAPAAAATISTDIDPAVEPVNDSTVTAPEGAPPDVAAAAAAREAAARQRRRSAEASRARLRLASTTT